MLQDKLKMDGSHVEVIPNQYIPKIYSIMSVVILLVCGGLSVAIIAVTESPIKYLTIPGSFLFWGFYQFSYLPAALKQPKPLEITDDTLIYAERDIMYRIPMAAIAMVEDQSYYVRCHQDAKAKWNDALAITIKTGYSIITVSEGTERILKSGCEKPVQVVISELNIRHADYLRIKAYLCRKLDCIS